MLQHVTACAAACVEIVLTECVEIVLTACVEIVLTACVEIVLTYSMLQRVLQRVLK